MCFFLYRRHDQSASIGGRCALLTLIWLLCTGSPVYAWHTLQHQIIAEAALAELPETMGQTFQPYREAILWGSMSPDFILRDWDHHEWNLHRSATDLSDAPAYLAQLSQETISLLRQTPTDLARIAERLGQLSHYLADLSQPLHTDEYSPQESDIHVIYEEDAYREQPESLISSSAGLRLITDIEDFAVAAAQEANLFYAAIIKSYTEGSGYRELQRITNLRLRHAIADVRDLWASIWNQANNAEPAIALSLNQHLYRSGDMIRLTLSSLPGKMTHSTGDLYVVLVDDHGQWTFLDSSDHFSTEILPLATEFQPGKKNEIILYNLPLHDTPTERVFQLYAVMVAPGGDPFSAVDRLSNLAAVEFTLTPLPDPAELLANLNDEPYLLPADNLQLEESVGLLLKRWDFVFVGGKRDDPLTQEHEDAYNNLIPGEYTHAMLYLGRDKLARPTFIELIAAHAPYLRLARMAETEPPYPDGIDPLLPVAIINPANYASRWASHLPRASKTLARQSAFSIYEQLVRDLTSDIPYQLEYDWSGSLSDFQVQLIDDGPANGASCTDYLLHLLEANAGICLKESRLTANNITNYFLFDPDGSTAPVPAEINPFPFTLTVGDILSMGYYPMDPPPHIFSCDSSTETGVPTPTRLSSSPDLQAATEVLLPPYYQNLWQP